ncbi:2-oxo-4-hydroxy-4-carboxy-5-ureidoimidazoline decarboxylase [Salisediminibacterium halotolerans]|uniref:2-oxo-4-hydroxy-4-carboxy-5-ureidoimidazoline decarboxylase n=1 Tax=Salisediminibacterium halotolerans TaxID=517425 RepID=A0A1H9T702_9BACI|nr:2-oxo-4-hydroxy-4-carboxy-5-ureidoimidazoline decarboxylase [Salisediminibacterium haloalkalitolerans]SER92867.1 2-oxo-4-hydroxy-4-carboxy-5-ureidoimidazoline decarboxylase [Salisediminibacterium haloalkalitolerans]
MYTVEEINQMTRTAFVEALGPAFEESPWVAERAYESSPFADRDQLVTEMIAVMHKASQEEKLALLNAHPDLGGKLAMTRASQSEQRGAGLDHLSENEYEVFSGLNRQYVASFGFPFIMAVKGRTKEEILTAMQERVNHGHEEEFQQALAEVGAIASFRLSEWVENNREGVSR